MCAHCTERTTPIMRQLMHCNNSWHWKLIFTQLGNVTIQSKFSIERIWNITWIFAQNDRSKTWTVRGGWLLNRWKERWNRNEVDVSINVRWDKPIYLNHWLATLCWGPKLQFVQRLGVHSEISNSSEHFCGIYRILHISFFLFLTKVQLG